MQAAPTPDSRAELTPPVCPASVQEDGDLACQIPDQRGHGLPPDDGTVALVSTAPLRVADNFRVLVPGSINRTCWWGTYLDIGAPGACTEADWDDFTIRYRASTSTALPPVVPFLGNFQSVSTLRAPTGQFIGSGGGNLIEFVYSASHPEVNLTNTNCYWLEIINVLPQPAPCVWLWEAAAGDNLALQDEGNGYKAGLAQALGSYGDHVLTDLAWCAGREPEAGEVVIDPAGCQFIGGCCDDATAACSDDQSITDCLAMNLRFGGNGSTCSNMICGGGICCVSDACGEAASAKECPNSSYLTGTFCDDIASCPIYNSCSWDNGVMNQYGSVFATQLAHPDSDPDPFVAESADDFYFDGSPGNDCIIHEITFWVEHFNHAAGGCAGNPECDDNPGDYLDNPDGGIQVVIYAHSTENPGPGGMPENIMTPVPCVTTPDCIAAGCPEEAMCNGMVCEAGGETCDFIVPTGNHLGNTELVIKPAYTWEALESPPGTIVPHAYRVTLQLPDTPLEKTSYWLAIVPQLPLTGYYQTAWMQSTNYNGTSARQIFEAMDIFPWTPFNVDLAFSIEGEPKCTPTPSSFQFCADANNDGKRDDPCLWYSSCDVFFCFQAPRGYANGGQYGQADMGSPAGANQCEVDGVADANDSFHALRCFSNQNFMGAIGYPCEDNAPPPPQVPKALNVDAGSNASCVLDGICDGNDAFHALRSFSNTNFMGGPGYPCTCPGSETMAAQRVEPREWTGLTLRAPRSARPGELVDVEVFLDSDINHLTGFQLHLGTAGGKATDLELVDISADIQHRNHAYAGVEGTWSAYNRAVGQMVMGVNTLEGFPARAGAYLATFTYRVPANAAGTYAVDVLYGPSESNMENRTYLFGYSSGPIGVTSATPAEIRVSRAREE